MFPTTPQTLDEILADGHAALNAERAAQERANAEREARIEEICNVALTVAKQYLPAPLHPYARVVFDYPESVHVHLEIPDAMPVSMTLDNDKATSDLDDPAFDIHANWHVYTNRYHREIFIWNEAREDMIFTGSFADLPRALVIARSNYRAPKSAPAPEPEKPVTQSLYGKLSELLDCAEDDLHETNFETANGWIGLTIARALVDIADTLDTIRRDYQQVHFS